MTTYAETVRRDQRRQDAARIRWDVARETHDRLCADGGATISATGITPGGTGYVVANPTFTRKVRTCTVETIARYLAERADTLSGDEVYLGVWQGPEAVYLDVCEVIADRAEALMVADLRAELAIFDLSTGESIDV